MASSNDVNCPVVTPVVVVVDGTVVVVLDEAVVVVVLVVVVLAADQFNCRSTTDVLPAPALAP